VVYAVNLRTIMTNPITVTVSKVKQILGLLPPNMTPLMNNFYIVRTQAGFNQALKHYSDGDRYVSRGYPRQYPALICLSLGYEGYHFVSVKVLPLGYLRKQLKSQ
jgi:hypothetical protein